METKAPTYIIRLGHLALIFLLSCGSSPELRFLTNGSDRINVKGVICTEDPRSITNPVKIIFAVDTSGSMGPHVRDGMQLPGNDPNGLRADAVQQVVNTLIIEPNYKFGVISFSDGADALTNPDGFTRDQTLLTNSVNMLRQDEGGTNMAGAVNEVSNLIINDVFEMEEEGGSAALTKYAIVLLSDGIPQTQVGNEAQQQQLTLDNLEQLMSLKETLDVGDILFHGAFLGADPQGKAFMQQLVATANNGVFLEFNSPDQINFLQEELNFEPLKIAQSLVDIFVVNRNAISENIESSQPGIYPDSDGDGLADFEEINIGTNPLKTDTDGDFISDLNEVKRGLRPLKAETTCQTDMPEFDKDNDGMTNCDEAIAFTDSQDPDTDEDGIPDALEYLRGTDPLISDHTLDLENDGIPNASEIRQGLNPSIDDASLLETHGIRYSISFINIDDDGNYCYNINISNIKLADTETLPGESGPKNTLEVYLQTRFTDGSEKDTFQRAQVPIYLEEFYADLDGSSGDIRIETLDFELMGTDD